MKRIVASAKGGRVGVAMVRDPRGAMDREGAKIGLLIALEEPTRARQR